MLAVPLSFHLRPPLNPDEWRVLWIMRLETLVEQASQNRAKLLRSLNDDKREFLQQSDLDQWPSELAYSPWVENALEQVSWRFEKEKQAEALRYDQNWNQTINEYRLAELVNDL